MRTHVNDSGSTHSPSLAARTACNNLLNAVCSTRIAPHAALFINLVNHDRSTPANVATARVFDNFLVQDLVCRLFFATVLPLDGPLAAPVRPLWFASQRIHRGGRACHFLSCVFFRYCSACRCGLCPLQACHRRLVRHLLVGGWCRRKHAMLKLVTWIPSEDA